MEHKKKGKEIRENKFCRESLSCANCRLSLGLDCSFSNCVSWRLVLGEGRFQRFSFSVRRVIKGRSERGPRQQCPRSGGKKVHDKYLRRLIPSLCIIRFEEPEVIHPLHSKTITIIIIELYEHEGRYSAPGNDEERVVSRHASAR